MLIPWINYLISKGQAVRISIKDDEPERVYLDQDAGENERVDAESDHKKE